jgi:LysR family glycine cleavage system transcriptional activator
LALQAAIDGLGIAMGYVELAAIDLAEGRLVQPFAAAVQHPWSYYIVIPEDNVGDFSRGQCRRFADGDLLRLAAGGSRAQLSWARRIL